MGGQLPAEKQTNLIQNLTGLVDFSGDRNLAHSHLHRRSLLRHHILISWLMPLSID